MNELKFFHPDQDVTITRHRLPHWQQGGCACAVTFRLADSLPRHPLDAWGQERTAWLEHHPEPWTDDIEREYHRRFTDRIHEWLDAGHGSCVLREPGIAAMVAARLRIVRKGAGHALWAFAVMPNHVHVLISLGVGCNLPRLIRLWKGGSAHEINRALGRAGRLWQPEYFDRLVRTPQHFARCLDDIRDNPATARLTEGATLCRENSDARILLQEYVTKHGAI